MTKKAAKKKQVGKKASKKKTTAKKAAKEANASVDEKSPKEEKGKEVVAEDSRKEAPASLPVRSSRVVRPDEKERGGGPSRSRPSRRGGRREGGSRVKVDEEELGTKAWKVFQQEIAEEGLALIDEKAARLLAEKSIIVTRAFLEERERRFGRKEAGKESSESAKDQNESGGNEDKG